MKTLENLFLKELADHYDSEKRLVVAMPKMEKNAICPELKKVLATHLKETKHHVQLVEAIFEALGETPKTQKCEATVGLIKEAEEMMSSFKGSPAIDSVIASAARKIEHYEIVSCECLINWAKLLGHKEAAGNLKVILDEEKAADKSVAITAHEFCDIQALGEDAKEPKERELAGVH